ncbi:uncharacterized protein EHS24_007260 [Apiotrichum porosum]|uniref:Uncharacterized protein n=1 Tax=Apiotrichum porosum TaxID=105984 RepID=A0A427XXM8_9TREE|nr:uncharacterized protein EHS24_007260 [Apiotrichum porosum]RSH83572.1 hypothetical protein EHS24_007260 [Apiotrichum porosum]
MGKQTKSKPTKGAKGAAPYGKKPSGPKKATVEVTYEGQAKPAAAPKAGKKAAAEAKAPKAKADKPAPKAVKAEGKAEGKKDKGKARAASPEAEVDVEDEEELVDDAPAPTFKIMAGSYEKLLYGLEGSYPAGSDVPVLEPIFIFPAHMACVKAVAASAGGKWLATGSEDEFIKVWDLRRKKEVGSLSQHTGSITSLAFPSSSHLLASSDDSTISLFRSSDWALLKSLKGHSGRVNHVDVHPTGRVALSVGKDQTLKMWDLMRGRGAASLPLGSEAELVKFSPRGTHFAVLYPKKVEIYSLTLKLMHTLETKSRFNHLLFADVPGSEAELLCIGTEKGVVEVYDVEIGQADDDEDDEDDDEEDEDEENAKGPFAIVDRVATLVGHTNRIKDVSSINFTAPSGPTVLLTTVSSDGFINLYDLAAAQDGAEVQPVASYDTNKSRLTCVSITDGGAPRQKKSVAVASQGGKNGGARFAVEDDEDEEESSDEEEDAQDMYDVSDAEEEDEDEMEVEFEDEEEGEEE